MSLNPATVSVYEDGIHVAVGGLDVAGKLHASAEDAAAYLALDIWRGREYWPHRNKLSEAFDWAGFDALVDARCDALQATNGWRLHATGGEYTVWALPGLEYGSSDIVDRAFQVTKGEVPSSDGGYRRLEPILGIKNLRPADIRLASGDECDVRAEPGLDGGKHVWRGFVRDGAGWVMTTDDDGQPEAYPGPDEARAESLAFLERSREEAAAPGP